MKALRRIAAAMAALGISPADANSLSRLGVNKRGISKHAFNKTSRGAGRRSRCKLKIARGAGSINAKSDALQLARDGHWLEAANMVDDHQRQCGESIVSPTVREVWRSYAIEDAIGQR